jgi:hypothetical protein
MYFKRLMMALVIFFFTLTIVASQVAAEGTKTESITVVIGSDCACGSHVGSFDTMYKGKKISVDFYFNSNPANPIEKPIKVFKENNEVKDWSSILCPRPGESKVELSGKQVVVDGLFKDKTSFEAHQISIIAETSNPIMSFSGLLDKMENLRTHETELRLQKEFESFKGKTLTEDGWKIINVKSSPKFEKLYCANLSNVKGKTLIIEKIPENIALDMKAGKSIKIKGTVIQYLYGNDMSFTVFQMYGFYFSSSALLAFYAN